MLHKRFNDEGIAINYPMRTLQFPEGWGPETMMSRNGQEMDGRGSTQQEPVGAMSNGGNHRRRGLRRRTPRTPRLTRGTDEDAGGEGDGPDAG